MDIVVKTKQALESTQIAFKKIIFLIAKTFETSWST